MKGLLVFVGFTLFLAYGAVMIVGNIMGRVETVTRVIGS